MPFPIFMKPFACLLAGMALTSLAAGPEDVAFTRVWKGRHVLDAELPFPEGVSFLPAAHYAAEVKSLPAEMRIEDRSGNVIARFAAPDSETPPFTMHLALTGRHKPAVFTTKDGRTRLAYIGDVPGPSGFDIRAKTNTTSLAVRPYGGAGPVTATMSAGVGQADVRFVTRGRHAALYLEGGRLFFTFSARFYGSAMGVGSLDPEHPERGVRYEGQILFDYGDGLLRNDLAAHIFLDDETGEWRGWSSNFSTGSDALSKRAPGGLNAIWCKTNPLHGLSVMRAKSLGLDGMNEDPSGVWDPAAKKWRLYVSAFVPKDIRGQILESDLWDGGFRPITAVAAENSTGTTIASMDGRLHCLSGSSDRAYYVYSYPSLELRGKLSMSPTPWRADAKGWAHGRGWPAFAEIPGREHRYILLTMDRENFPGMPKPNWTYGELSIYCGSRTIPGRAGQ